MEHLVVTGVVDGKRARGRQRDTFLTYLGKFTNKPPMELLRLKRKELSGLSCVQNNNQRLYEDMILIDYDNYVDPSRCVSQMCVHSFPQKALCKHVYS